MTDDPYHKDGCPLGCDVCNDSRAALNRIHTVVGKSAFGPQTPEEVAVFVEEYFKADAVLMQNVAKQRDNAKKKADDYRRALDRAKIQIAKLKGQLEAF